MNQNWNNKESEETQVAYDDSIEPWWGSRAVLSVVGILVAIMGALILYFYFQTPDTELENESIPIIEPEEGFVKEQPMDPGGEIIPYQDKQIYEGLSGEPSQDNVLAPLATQSMPSESADPSSSFTEALPVNEPSIIEDVTQPMEPEPLELKSNLEPSEASMAASELSQGQFDAQGGASLEINNYTVNNKTIMEQPKKEDAPKPSVKSAPKFTVQLGSLGSSALAEKEWNMLKKRYPSMLKDLSMEIQKADLESKGTFYRIRVGPFESKKAARDFCNKMRAKGGRCQA